MIWKEVPYRVVIGRNGRILGDFIETPPEQMINRGRRRGKRARIPKQSGRTGDTAEFLCDKTEYVFGVGPDRERASLRHKLFMDKLEQCVRDSGDEAVAKLIEALLEYERNPVPALPEDVDTETFFVFQFEGELDTLISDRPQVREYWHRQRHPDTAASSSKEFTCLITGKPCVPVGRHPPVRRVPGGGPSTPLVSFDDAVFESYRLSKNENAPISSDAAEAYVAGLNRLLDREYRDADGNRQPSRRVDLSRDTAVVFWSREGSDLVDLFAEVMDASPEAVRVLFESPYTGRRPVLDDPQAFYAAVISGAKGRAVLRQWMETTVADAARSVRRYFDDIAIVQPGGDIRPQPLRHLLRSTAAFGETDNIPPHLAADVFAAILRETTPYPHALLDASVRRMRAEQSRRDPKAPWRSGPVPPERAALIKAYLSRARCLSQLAPNFPEVTMSLDEKCSNVPYRLGRLFAVLERLQEVAVRPSATIRDRFFGAASSNPVTVFQRLIRGAQPHVSKADAGPYFDKMIGEIIDGLPSANPFPATLTLQEQGLFAVGYYHQRQALFMKKTASDKLASTTSKQ